MSCVLVRAKFLTAINSTWTSSYHSVSINVHFTLYWPQYISHYWYLSLYSLCSHAKLNCWNMRYVYVGAPNFTLNFSPHPEQMWYLSSLYACQHFSNVCFTCTSTFPWFEKSVSTLRNIKHFHSWSKIKFNDESPLNLVHISVVLVLVIFKHFVYAILQL